MSEHYRIVCEDHPGVIYAQCRCIHLQKTVKTIACQCPPDRTPPRVIGEKVEIGMFDPDGQVLWCQIYDNGTQAWVTRDGEIMSVMYEDGTFWEPET